MANEIITIGIDLGTTNSSIAINVNGKIEIMKKTGGSEYTPSVIGFDKNNNKIVGEKAYDQLYKFSSKDNDENFVSEIKRIMGSEEMVCFKRKKIKMSPEEISAEILISLKEDALRRYPDLNTIAAVITIPAAFSVLQSEATKRAGKLAGFDYVVLLQEPIAAAVSYGFMNAKDENWLIYDLGGGTFDVALVSCKNGILTVLAHNGDNFLGGKDIDKKIIDDLIVPKLISKYKLSDFMKSNLKYTHIFSKLKYFAEMAKIELSQYKETTIIIDGIGSDENNIEMQSSIRIFREELNEIIKPIVDKSINLSNKTLQDANIDASLVDRIILIGGPTETPYIKDRLKQELKIKVDSSVDPLTAVARGACIYGMSKIIPEEYLKNILVESEKHNIYLNHSTLTSDDEESLTGSIDGLKDNEQYHIQILSDSGVFTGKKIKITNGKFYYPINLESNKTNMFWIYVFDSKGKSVKISQESFTITHGISVSGSPIPHSIGVVIASGDVRKNMIINTYDKIFEKGSILPLKKTLDFYKTSKKLIKGEDNTLDIIVMEGESDIPNRNTFLCKCGIIGSELPYDLPMDTPIELTLESNESREVFITVYIPLIDKTLNARATIRSEKINIDITKKELEMEKDRLKTIWDECNSNERLIMLEKLKNLDCNINKNKNSEEEKMQIIKSLRELKIMIDEQEKNGEIIQIINRYNLNIADTQNSIATIADIKERNIYEKQIDLIMAEGSKAIIDNNKIILIHSIDLLISIQIRILSSNIEFWITQLRSIFCNISFSNELEAKHYESRAIIAINEKNIDNIRKCYFDILELIPKEEQEKVSGIKR